MIDEIDANYPRVLVATDCLSEGINLQEKFNAVIHYDLPWNPNRLEQREGRVDRYGQRARIVKTVRYFGRNNPVDGVVLDVLLNKAREIHVAGAHVSEEDLHNQSANHPESLALSDGHPRISVEVTITRITNVP